MRLAKAVFAILCIVIVDTAAVAAEKQVPSFKDYLVSRALTKAQVQNSIENAHRWLFDGELGVVDGPYVGEVGGVPGGVDGSATVGTFQKNGARTAFAYASRKPRINAYGDSFTHGDQVNDGETWEEFLAAHLREPIGNFGVGGYGVYQAYRRMLREEKTGHAGKYLILTVCCDDSFRSLYRSWLPIAQEQVIPRIFVGTKPNVEMDIRSGKFVEKENLLSTRESLARLSDPAWLVAKLGDDLALQLQLYCGCTSFRGEPRIANLDRRQIGVLADKLGLPFDWAADSRTRSVDRYGDPCAGAYCITPLQAQASALLNELAQQSTVYVLGQAKQFADEQGKKLLVVFVLNTDLGRLERSGTRDNQAVLDYVRGARISYVDLDQAFLDEYRKLKPAVGFQDYVGNYLVNGRGHLNAKGNMFFAFAIKDALLSMMDPKPPTYQVKGRIDQKYFFEATTGDRR